MKIHGSLFICLVLSTATYLSAQSPPYLSYQAVIRDNTGNVLVNDEVTVKFSVLIGAAEGEAVYSETHTKTTNAFGMLTLVVGDGTNKVGKLETIDWGGNSYFLKTELDPDGTSGFTEMGTVQLLSVPYALYAGHAGNASSSSFEDLTDTPHSLEGYGITDAATKQYVDSMLIRIGDIPKLLGSGYTVPQLLNGGRSLEELLADSVPLIDLYEAGISVTALYAEGVLVGSMQLAGIPEDVLVDAGMVGTLDDVEGNTYPWVKIGDQVWMAENLKATKYNDGSVITYPGASMSDWSSNTTGAYAWYDNDENAYKDVYGALYNWYAAGTGKLCPDGWHIPSGTEFQDLIDFLGGTVASTAKLMESGKEHWFFGRGTNESGFTALPGGFRANTSSFMHLGDWASFWGSGATSDTYAKCMYFVNTGAVQNSSDHKNMGFSIRCIKDQ